MASKAYLLIGVAVLLSTAAAQFGPGTGGGFNQIYGPLGQGQQGFNQFGQGYIPGLGQQGGQGFGPGFGGPGSGGPSFGGPGFGGPSFGGPGFGGPNFGAPSFGGPNFGGPVLNGPGFGQPGHAYFLY